MHNTALLDSLLDVVHLSGALAGAALEAILPGAVVVCPTGTHPVPLPEAALLLPLPGPQGRLAALTRVVALVADVAGTVRTLLVGLLLGLLLLGLIGLLRVVGL